MNDFFQKLYTKGSMDFYKIVATKLKQEKKMFIVTANPEAFILGENDKNYKELLLSKDTTMVPDGIGIVKAAKKLGYNVKERITGIDLATELLSIANKNKYRLALLGAKCEVIETLVKKISNDYSKIDIVAYENGYIDNKDKFFEKISSLQPDIVLVALGMPKQEELIYKHLSQFKKGIFVGVGGSFDVLSGMKKRAPEFFIKTNTEWLYRITKEPKRLKRFYQNNIKFLFKVKKLKKKR